MPSAFTITSRFPRQFPRPFQNVNDNENLIRSTLKTYQKTKKRKKSNPFSIWQKADEPSRVDRSLVHALWKEKQKQQTYTEKAGAFRLALPRYLFCQANCYLTRIHSRINGQSMTHQKFLDHPSPKANGTNRSRDEQHGTPTRLFF